MREEQSQSKKCKGRRAFYRQVIASNQPYEKVIGALEARLGPAQNWAAIGQQAAATHASWEQFTQVAREVEQKLEALVAEVTAGDGMEQTILVTGSTSGFGRLVLDFTT